MEENTNATAEGVTGADNATENGNQEGQEQKTYTQEDLQAESDKRVTEALKTAQAKWEKEFETKVSDLKLQWEKESKMTADERAKAEREKAEKAFKDEQDKFTRERLEFEVTKQLAEKKIPVGFAKLLCGNSAEEAKANIENFEKEYNAAIEEGVTQKLKGTTPKSTAKQTDSWLDSVRHGAGLK